MATTAQKMVQNWQNGVQQGGNAWNAGVQGYTGQAPGLLAVAKQLDLVNNFMNSVNLGVWAQKTGAVTTQDWKAACNQAVQKYAMGAQKGLKKYTNFAGKAIPVYAQMKQAADAANGPIAKVTAALQILIAAGKKAGGNAFV